MDRVVVVSLLLLVALSWAFYKLVAALEQRK